ncbi:hypothetical protein D3C87_1090790 [compost metagenome]
MSIIMTTILAGEEEPMQPVGVDKHGVHRFLENRIVRDVLECSRISGYGLNEIAVAGYSGAEHRQFAQLIGYSVSGYGDLSYVNEESCSRADALSDALLEDSNEA